MTRTVDGAFPAPGAGQEWRYPPADRDDVVDILHGTPVLDPYRWLEEPGAERTRRWVAAQRELAGGYLAGLAARPWFTACLDRILGTPRAGVPEHRGGRYLLQRNDGSREQDCWQLAEDLPTLVAGGGRTLLDPAEFDPDGRVSVTGVTLSPDGRWLAYGLNQAGSDWTTWRVRDAATGVDLDDRVTHAKFGFPQWLPASSGFLYWGFPATARTSGHDPGALPNGSLRCHRLGTPEADDEVVHRPAARREVARGQVTDDGRWLVLSVADGIARRNRVAVRRIGAGDALGPRLDVVGEAYAWFALAGSDGDLLYLRTDHNADRGRLVAVDLAALAAGGGELPDAAWRELVPERPMVLEQAVRAGDGFLAVYQDDASHRVYRLAADGTERGEVALDGPVAVAAVHGRAGEPEAFVGVTSFVHDTRCYRLDLATGGQEELPLVTRPAGTAAEVETRRGQATSADGTLIPYFLVRRADQPVDRPAPTILFGYGAHQIGMTPIFRPAWPAWVEAGGVLVVANLRGGGEYGRSWYESASRDRKQKVFDDYIAVAEDLVATGVTTREQLALHGRSHGGLLVSTVLTQRPHLAAVVLPMVGIMDMLRFHRFTIGWAWTPDHGDPEVPEDFAVLRAYSPLHQVREGTDYPAVLVLTGDHDDRAVPAHSYKFTAALQHASTGARPVLLRIDPATGHGGTGAASKPRWALVAETADLLAFAATHTGLAPEPRPDPARLVSPADP